MLRGCFSAEGTGELVRLQAIIYGWGPVPQDSGQEPLQVSS